MKIIIYIRDPECFLKGEMFMGLECCNEGDSFSEGHKVVAEIDLDLESIDRGEVVKSAVENIDREQKEILLKQQEVLQRLEKRKGELLALPAGEL